MEASRGIEMFSMLKLSHYHPFFSLDFEYKTYTVEVPSPL